MIFTASFQVLDFVCVLIDQNSREKNATIAETVHDKFQRPSVLQRMLFD